MHDADDEYGNFSQSSESEDINETVQNVEQAVRDLQHSVDKIREAVRDKWNSLQLIGLVFVVIWVWSFAEDFWYSKWRYAMYYSVDSEKVTIEKQPHDCAFLAAPVGTKYCHYDREISSIRWATSTAGNPIVSYDEGKTWEPFTPDSSVTVPKPATVERVFITWKKVDE